VQRRRYKKETKMSKITVPFNQYARETVAALQDPGLLLTGAGADGVPNTMAIGWGIMGVIWGKPMFVVLVRPSRFTYSLIEECGDFTVNVVPPAMRQVVEYCGTRSGRDVDKFAEQPITGEPAQTVNSPVIAESAIVYECQVVHTNDVNPDGLVKEIVDSAYAKGDFHRLYYGEIMKVQADPAKAAKLSG
jgi:flavin reductase (DIM6/NTAB) family NADH-FMN oxidoreductase RutF